MPSSLARKIMICAAVDGLVIQPLAQKSQRNTPNGKTPQPVKVKYGGAVVSSLARDQLPDNSRPSASFEAFGVIGLFTVSRLSYLITITDRQQVAQIRGYPVYVVTDVALTPCTSQTEAEAAIGHTSIQLRRASRISEDAEGATTESDTETASLCVPDDADDVQSDREEPAGNDSKALERHSSIAENVIRKRGSYGRFAQRWFSSSGWQQDQKRSLGVSDTDDTSKPGATDKKSVVDTDSKSNKKVKGDKEDRKVGKAVMTETADKGVETAVSTGETLIPKLLRMAHIWFGTSRSFYFSYDVDITRNLGNSNPVSPGASLYATADPLFFWNRNMLRPFEAANESALMLPLMQGFVGQRLFVMDSHPPQVDSDKSPESMELNEWTLRQDSSLDPEAESLDLKLRPSEKKFLITVVSRRSTQRAGLRYLRRGVDDNGHTANGVETEQILSAPEWTSGNIYSFLQTRGSIPLFFTQNPYSLKPVPELQHSESVNLRAFSRHFDQMCARYGKMQLVNLVEKRGVEALIGNAYQNTVEAYNQAEDDEKSKLEFEWFDFHSACRGMKFENVSLLLDTLGNELERLGTTVEAQGKTVRKQQGVLRTNCMDCLDRTNVCQSSFGRYMLELQLKEEGFELNAQIDQATSWFNMLWADNGDAISKQYASTAAMKGDFTRTRKRDYRGMVNDLGLSLTRLYNGMVNDYFSQAAIDFFLGNVTSLVFDEFEANMMTMDPAISMTKMRDLAIETSRKIVVQEDKEDLVSGWTMLSPHQSNTIKSLPFEEVVLLLTDTALYLCHFDWKLDKVSSFERVDFAHVTAIQTGAYVTSTISPAHADETKNVGLVVTYEPGKDDIQRVNTRSLSSMSGSPGEETVTAPREDANREQKPAAASAGVLAPIFGGAAKPQAPERKKVALKALYAHTYMADVGSKCSASVQTEAEQVDAIAAEIERLVFSNQRAAATGGSERKSIVEKSDIISLAEAKKSTGLLEQLGHSIKKFVWA